ncbi:lamin tail domain-containing protein [Candidatus Woesearchaeota archaeon]|nr:lamin tail domain-containing protein [Candidatus Woesearchaeota archaeon]
MKLKKLLFMLLLIAEPVSALMFVNEIMYNPEGNDNNKEFIEIYSDENISLENYTFSDSESNDTLQLIKRHNSSYYLIVEEGFNCTGINASVYSAGTTIGNNLNNDGDTILLYDLNLTLILNVSYSGGLANGNGKSLEFFNNSWLESLIEGGTPGRENSVLTNISNNTVYNETNTTGNFSTNNTNSTDIDINATVNETNTTNTTTENNCNASIDILTGKELYQSGEQIKFKFNLSNNSQEFIIEYWVEDLFGEILKNKRNTTNLNEKSYTPKINEADKVILIRANLFVDCSNDSFSASKQLVVKNNNPTQNNAPEDEEEEPRKKSSGGGYVPKYISYELINFTENKTIGKEFSTLVKINNPFDEEHLFTVWSYVYRSSKCYSGDREQNKKTISLTKNSTIVELKNIVLNANSGQYKLKVKIKKDSQKTNYEITGDINLVEEVKTQINTSNHTNSSSVEIKSQTNISNEIIKIAKEELNSSNSTDVYQSKDSRIRNAIIYFVLGLFVIIAVVLVWKS